MNPNTGCIDLEDAVRFVWEHTSAQESPSCPASRFNRPVLPCRGRRLQTQHGACRRTQLNILPQCHQEASPVACCLQLADWKSDHVVRTWMPSMKLWKLWAAGGGWSVCRYHRLAVAKSEKAAAPSAAGMAPQPSSSSMLPDHAPKCASTRCPIEMSKGLQSRASRKLQPLLLQAQALDRRLPDTSNLEVE